MWVQKLSIRELQREEGEHSYTEVRTTASTEVTTMPETKTNVVLSTCFCNKITEEKKKYWLPRPWTPHHSVHSYIPLGVILLCCIFIYLSHCTHQLKKFSVSLLHKCVCDSTSYAVIQHFRAAQKEPQQS